MAAAALSWTVGARVLLVSAMRTLGSLYGRIQAERPHWIVVVRTHARTAEVFHYAYRPGEIEEATIHALPDGLDATLEDALNLHEGTSTPTTTGRRAPASARSGPGPAGRLIDRDAAGKVVAIGEPTPVVVVAPPAPAAPRTRSGYVLPDTAREKPNPGDLIDTRGFGTVFGNGLGGALGGVVGGALGGGTGGRRAGVGAGTRGSRATPAQGRPTTRGARESTVESSLSAEAPAEVQVKQDQIIEFRIELAAEAQPLALEIRTETRVDQPIVVSLSLENDHLRVKGPSEHRVAPPQAGDPRYGYFEIKGQTPGAVRAAVTFRQGASVLGTIALAIEVVAGAPNNAFAEVKAAVASPDPRDAETLVLEIEMRTEGRSKRFYEFRLRNEALGLPFEVLASKPLLDRGDKPAKALFDYVERVYEKTTQPLSNAADLADLQRQMRALGARLSDELFQPDVVARLWPLRSRIGMIRLVSWEPFIPWELVRMREPKSGDIDERFLAEYGLVRTMAGDTPPLTLSLRDWSWLGAEFPMGTHEDCSDTDYFTVALPKVRGITPTRVGPGPDFLDTLNQAAFDVLHVACHAESPQKKMDSAWLVLGDKAKPGTSDPVLIRVDTDGVKAEATQLRKRRPLVFLNACESGRVGPNLTAWGGWPEVFVRAGAGAFVGTAWAVRNKPAALFSQAFYDALLDGKMLYEAAGAARNAARAAGDASWLAFKVYGHPFAVKGDPT